MKTISITLFSLLLLTFTKELKAQVISYEKWTVEEKIVNGNTVFQNPANKKADTTYYFELNIHPSSNMDATISYKYHLNDSETFEGEFTSKKYYHRKTIRINPPNTILKFDKKRYWTLIITNGKDKTEYYFHMHRVA